MQRRRSKPIQALLPALCAGLALPSFLPPGALAQDKLDRVIAASGGVPVTGARPLGDKGDKLNAAIDVGLGTTGVSGHIQVGLTRKLAARLGYNWLDYSVEDQEYDDIVYDGDLEFSGFGGYVDLHPFENAFTISAGALVGDKAVGLSAAPLEPVEIGGTVFDPSAVGEIIGDADFPDSAYFLGIGYDPSLYADSRVVFIFRAGVMMADRAEVQIEATGLPALEAVDPDLAALLRAELEAEEADLEDDIDRYAFWPVITMGLGYRF
jgi:hypothetical protein